jgi:hypothetical protein
MARWVKVTAAQLGPINEGTSRDEVVERMLFTEPVGSRS